MHYTFNFLRILQQLQQGQEDPNDLWWEKSHQDTKKFWQDLFNFYRSQLSTLPKSYPFERYDFYHDIIFRNFQSERIAFRWYEEEKGWQSISFADLHEYVLAEAEKWASYGIQAGQTICVVLPMGLQYAVSLLTSLRVGTIFSYLPPLGDRFLEKRLKILAPDYIISNFLYKRLLGDWEKLLLENQEKKPILYDQISYNYNSGDVVARLFSPLSKNSHIPIPLSADNAYLHAMRDAITTFFLRPGDAITAPGFCVWQSQPSLLLTAWLIGAEYVHIDLSSIEKKPEILQEKSFRNIGISAKLRDILLNSEKLVRLDTQNIFRNCADPLYWSRWSKLVEKCHLQEIPVQNILHHSAFGGSILTSWPNKGVINQKVRPSVGLEWQLTNVNLSGQIVQNMGLYTVEKEEDQTPLGTILLVRDDAEWLYAGSHEPRHSCRSYPTSEILAIISTLDFVQQADCVSLSNSSAAEHILIVFVGYCEKEKLEENKKEWVKKIEDNITLHLGIEFLPDKIEFYPLYAPSEKNIVDHNWCYSQYCRGYLHRKSQNPFYALLNQLRSFTIFP